MRKPYAAMLVAAAAFATAAASPAMACSDPVGCLPLQDARFPQEAEAVLEGALAGDWRRMQALLPLCSNCLSATTPTGETLLQRAMGMRDKRAFGLLLKAGADPSQHHSPNESVVHLAARHEDPNWLRLLLKAGANPDTINLPQEDFPLISNALPLGVALISGRDRQFEMLLKSGANVKLADRTGNTALHLAAQINQPWHVLALLKTGADPLARNTQGQSFQPYLFMTKEELLTKHNRTGRNAVRAYLKSANISIE